MAKTKTLQCTIACVSASSFTGAYRDDSSTTALVGKKSSRFYRTKVSVTDAPDAEKIEAAVLRLNVEEHGSAIGNVAHVLNERYGEGGYMDANISGVELYINYADPGEQITVDITEHLKKGIVDLILRAKTEPPYTTAWCGFGSADVLVTLTDVSGFYVVSGGVLKPVEAHVVTDGALKLYEVYSKQEEK